MDDNKNITCNYFNSYFNYELKRWVDFRCEEKCVGNSQLCIFHTPLDNKENFVNEFNKKIREEVGNNKPVYLIGYFFPRNFHLIYSGVHSHHSQSSLYTPDKEAHQHIPDLKTPIYFSKSQIRGDITFTNTHFTGMYFDNVTFGGRININAYLFENVSFKECIFSEAVSFVLTRMNNADFSRSKFNKSVNFLGGIFYKIHFIGIEFFTPTNFSDITVYELGNFSSCVFNKDVYFTGGRFHGITIFNFSTFKDKIEFSTCFFEKRSSFNNVFFEMPEKVVFNGINLANVSFMHTDITRVRFGDVGWRGDAYKVIDEEDLEWSLKPLFNLTDINLYSNSADNLRKFLKYIGIKDTDQINFTRNKDKIELQNNSNIKIGEIYLEQEGKNALLKIDNETVYNFYKQEGNKKIYFTKKINLQSLLTIYRNLRENYEYQLRYEEAGKFFIREMELKRKYEEKFGNNLVRYYDGYSLNIKNSIKRRFSLTGLYYGISRYGESVTIPVLMGFGIIILSTFIFMIESNPLDEFSLSKIIWFEQFKNTTHLGLSLDRSLTDFMPLFLDNNKYTLGVIDYTIKILGGILTFGLIVIALRRKFERKIRH